MSIDCLEISSTVQGMHRKFPGQYDNSKKLKDRLQQGRGWEPITFPLLQPSKVDSHLEDYLKFMHLCDTLPYLYSQQFAGDMTPNFGWTFHLECARQSSVLFLVHRPPTNGTRSRSSMDHRGHCSMQDQYGHWSRPIPWFSQVDRANEDWPGDQVQS